MDWTRGIDCSVCCRSDQPGGPRARRGWSRSWPNLEFSGTSDLVLDGDRMLHAQIDFVGTIDADGGPGELLIPSAGNQDVMLQRLRPSDGAW